MPKGTVMLAFERMSFRAVYLTTSGNGYVTVHKNCRQQSYPVPQFPVKEGIVPHLIDGSNIIKRKDYCIWFVELGQSSNTRGNTKRLTVPVKSGWSKLFSDSRCLRSW